MNKSDLFSTTLSAGEASEITDSVCPLCQAKSKEVKYYSQGCFGLHVFYLAIASSWTYQNLCIFLERKIHTAYDFQKSYTCERIAWGRGKGLTYKDCKMLERESFLKAHFRKFLFLLSIGLFASRQPLIQGHQILYSCLSFLLYEDHHKFI